MVNDVIFGAAPEIDTDDLNGFVLWFYLAGTEIEETRKTYIFDVRVMDVQHKDMSNESISDTYKIAKDLLAWMDTEQYYSGYQFDRDADVTNFSHYSLSDFEGHQLFLSLNQKMEYDGCEVPMWRHLIDHNGNFVVDHEMNRIIV